MSGPYREAFVELAQDVFDEAKALGEQIVEAAVIKATAPDPPRVETRATALFTLDSITYLVSEYLEKRGFKTCDVQRRAGYETTIARVRLPCRHIATFALDDPKMWSLSCGSEIVNYVLDVLDGEPRRRCYCVQYEPPVPCTAGKCAP